MTSMLGSAAIAHRAMPKSAGGPQAWTRLRTEWIFGPPCSLRSFADSHGVSYSSLCRRARAERWRRKRDDAQSARRRREFERMLSTAIRRAFAAGDRLRRLAAARKRRRVEPAELARAADVTAREVNGIATYARWLDFST
jgi:hypothetical protein